MSGFWHRIISEAIEIQLDDNTINKDIGLHLSDNWKQAFKFIKALSHALF